MRRWIFRGILPIKPSQIPTDVVAGIALDTMSIPEATIGLIIEIHPEVCTAEEFLQVVSRSRCTVE
jgi:hypothetical protein